ncbi:MAG: DnaJ domain-containing protein [Chloroflexi bacterium]|nr:DnaJ domain-containing protein [Chloroflexota bacterium]
MERPDRFDPYRVLGVPPGAPIDEVKAAYRRLAKRHHPDAAGPGELARFLTVQAAYETIARSHVTDVREPSGPRGAPGPAARGSQRDAGRDWYTAAREAARARSRAGRGHGAGPRARGGHGAPGSGQAAPGGSSPGAEAPGQARAGQGRAGRASETSREESRQRKATLGSTTYDDAPEEQPAWHGAGWYGAASGTYWTVNPREYADPRKHGPEYLGRTSEWTGDRPAASFTSARADGPRGTPGGRPPASDTAGRPTTPEPGDRRPRGDDGRGPGDPDRPARRHSGIAAVIRAALGVRGPGRPRVR